MNTHSLDLEASSSQFAEIADGSQTGLDVTGNCTIEIWKKFESLPPSGDQMNFVTKYLSTGNQRGYRFFLNDAAGTRTLQLQYSSDGTGANTIAHVSSAITITTGVYYHFAVAFTAASHASTFYKDGSAVGTDTGGSLTSIFDSNESFKIGANGSLDFFADGLVDEVRVWNSVRSGANISANYNREIGTDANLKGYWKFNNDYLDSSGNGNTLTPSGSPVFSTVVPFVEATAGGAFLLNLI